MAEYSSDEIDTYNVGVHYSEKTEYPSTSTYTYGFWPSKPRFILHPDNGSGYRKIDRYIYYSDSSGAGSYAGKLKMEIKDSKKYLWNYSNWYASWEDVADLRTTYRYTQDGDPNTMGGLISQIIQPDGGVIDRVYDTEGRMIEELSPEISYVDGTETITVRSEQSIYYNSDGKIKMKISEVYTTTEYWTDYPKKTMKEEYEYNSSHNLYRLIRSEYNDQDVLVNIFTKEFVYDDFGRQVGSFINDGTIPTIITSETIYDERGLVFQAIERKDTDFEKTTQYEYDLNGNRRYVIENPGAANERISEFEYDGFGRMITQIDPMGNETRLIPAQRWCLLLGYIRGPKTGWRF